MDNKIRNKRGQMTIWVIVAIAIVAVVILLFTIKLKSGINTGTESSPEQFIQTCVRAATLEAVDKMLPQGGFVAPQNYKVYQNTKIEYLCQNLGNYKPCINQHPAFFNEEKQEIKNYILPRAEQCFSQLQTESGKRNEKIEFGEMNLSVDLAPDKILINIDRKTSITSNGETSSFSEYKTEIDSSLYNLANVAIEIGSQQAKYCYFEYVGYMILYPRYDIRVFTMSDSTRIYTIKDNNSGKKMNIAIRSCAVPPGI